MSRFRQTATAIHFTGRTERQKVRLRVVGRLERNGARAAHTSPRGSCRQPLGRTARAPTDLDAPHTRLLRFRGVGPGREATSKHAALTSPFGSSATTSASTSSGSARKARRGLVTPDPRSTATRRDEAPSGARGASSASCASRVVPGSVRTVASRAALVFELRRRRVAFSARVARPAGPRGRASATLA